MPVAAPADKRFRRAHVAPASRRTWRRSWRMLLRIAVVVAIAGYVLYRMAGLVLAADALTINRVSVVGHSRMSLGEIQGITDAFKGTSMVTADLEGWRGRLREIPWVRDAAIRRVFPGTVLVIISERQPVGIGRVGNDLFLIDDAGIVIDEFNPRYAELDLPVIDGLGEPRRGGAIDPVRAALAGRVLAQLERRPDLAKLVSQIDVTDPRDAAVILKDDTAVVRLGQDRFAERIQSYVDLRPALRERVDDIDYVDLRFDQRVYVRPRVSRSPARQGPGIDVPKNARQRRGDD